MTSVLSVKSHSYFYDAVGDNFQRFVKARLKKLCYNLRKNFSEVIDIMQDLLLEADIQIYIVKKLKERLVKSLKKYRDKKSEETRNFFCAFGFLGAASFFSNFFEEPRCAMPRALDDVRKRLINIDEIDFLSRIGEKSFSAKLLQLIDESGEKDSTIYNRASIDRRHFSKIRNRKDYQPSKQTALSFAIALELDYDKTQKLLATAGYTLGGSTISDIIISYFIEHQIYNVDKINEILYKYGQPLLGGDPDSHPSKEF